MKKRNKQPRRGIYLLPNLLTTAGLFAGFYGIVAAMNSKFEAAAVAIFVAMFMDGLDGRIARLTNTNTAFGVEYDSLSDMISFGLAPALIVYQWLLSSLGKLGWLAAFVYAAATALRLARFNTQAGSEDKRFFQGLPSPCAAAVIAGLVWLGETQTLVTTGKLVLLALPLTLVVSLLMVSNIRFYSFKQRELNSRVPFVGILLLVALFALVALEPPLVLFLMALVYVISGPIMTLISIRKHREARKLRAE